MTPPQKPGRSRQDFATPEVFINAVKRLLEIDEFAIDLAADGSNTKADRWIDAKTDSLSIDWKGLWQPSYMKSPWYWLNPPFGHIEPWAKKCAEEGAKGVKVALLVPHGVQDWYVEHVLPNAYVFELQGRMSFDGIALYPKDLRLALFGTPFRGSRVWDWRYKA